MTEVGPRYHQLVFIWIRNPAMFAEYLQLLPPIVARYGGAADLSLRPTAIWADGLTLPAIVNLVHYDNKEAYQRFNTDPEFQNIEHLRAGSVDLITFEGYLHPTDPSPAHSPDRLYHVELVTYRDGTGEAYRTHEQHAEARMRAYGHRVEYAMHAEKATPGRPRPNLIKITSFPDLAARAAFDADPAHSKIEEKLYAAATTHDAVRLTGHAIG